MNTEELAGLIESVKVIPLRPDDVLMFRCFRPVSEELSARIREALRPIFGDRKILVTDPSFDIEVLRKEAACSDSEKNL